MTTVWVFDGLRVWRVWSLYHHVETSLRKVVNGVIVSEQHVNAQATNFFRAQRLVINEMIEIAGGGLDWLRKKHPLLR